jgi:hypothetical protein
MGVPLLATLEAFFDNNRNASVTSRVLRANRQTLLRRLERVASLTGVDLASAGDLFSVELAVRSRPQPIGEVRGRGWNSPEIRIANRTDSPRGLRPDRPAGTPAVALD